MNYPATLARIKSAFDITASLGNAPPRIQIFFVANLMKLLALIAIGLASFLNFQPIASGTGLVLFLWLGLMLAVATPQTDALLAASQRWLKPTWHISLAVLAIVIGVETTAVGAVLVWEAAGHTSLPAWAQTLTDALKPSDATAFTIQASENLLAEKNPYAHANIITAMDASPEAYNKITPLRTGIFADSFPYPTEDELESFWGEAITTPEVIPPEIESRFNYPAGSFLLVAPFTALGIDDMRIVLIVFAIPALIYAVLKVAPQKRLIIILGVLLSFELWGAMFDGDTKLLCLPFILVGYLLIPRRLWLSAIFIGIAAATRQTAWFFLPFYLILIWQTKGWRMCLQSGAIIGSVFLAANTPFLAANPQLWLTSVLAPMAGEMFPAGSGMVSLITSGVVPFDWPFLFTILELAAFGGGILWYIRNARRAPHAGLLLAVVPLFFAWRSLWSYFYFVDIILLAVVLSQEKHWATDQTRAPRELAAAT